MRKLIAVLMSCFSVSAFAATTPAIDFSTVGSPSIFNSTAQNSATVGGITIDAFTYSAGTYAPSQLWLRKDGELGFGVCSEGSSCGSPGTTGNGDYNELSNEQNPEVIRLTRPSNMQWSDLFVYSLDSGGSHSNESGILYWSDSATPVLGSLTGAQFSHNSLGANYGSIWNQVHPDPNAQYLFFTPDAGNGTNNDYLVWGANVSAVPEPATYALLLAGLGLVGFMVRRKPSLTA